MGREAWMTFLSFDADPSQWPRWAERAKPWMTELSSNLKGFRHFWRIKSLGCATPNCDACVEITRVVAFCLLTGSL